MLEYRGKSSLYGWVYGSLISVKNGTFIYHGCWFEPKGCEEAFIAVDPASVGQNTGLYAIGGKKIYTGDIVKITGLNRKIHPVVMRDGCFFAGINTLISSIEHETVEIIGNTTDNKLSKGCDHSTGEESDRPDPNA